MAKVQFVVEQATAEVESGKTIRQVALDNGVWVNRELFRGLTCGGRGLCGTCKCWVHELQPGAASPPTIREKVHGVGQGRRLACQARVYGDLEVTTVAGGDDRLGARTTDQSKPEAASGKSASGAPASERGGTSNQTGAA